MSGYFTPKECRYQPNRRIRASGSCNDSSQCPVLPCHYTGRQCSSAQSCKQSSSHFTLFSRHGDLCPLTHQPLSYLAVPHLAHPSVSYGHCNAQAACFLRGEVEISHSKQIAFILLASSGQLPALSLQKPGFEPRSVHVRFLVDTVAL